MRIKDIHNPWRDRLIAASFKGVVYHVEQQARSSGRRMVAHEYPKRDLPYAEDMGRHIIRYQVTGYVIGPNYMLRRDELIAVLEEEGPGVLNDPYVSGDIHLLEYGSGRPLYSCERYSVTESRERGGYAMFEMVFVESGAPGNSQMQTDTRSAVTTNAEEASTTVASTFDRYLLLQIKGQWPTT